MPEGHAILDCGAALDCIGEVAAPRTALAIIASVETRRPAVVDAIQRFKFGGDGDPVEASLAVTLPVQIGDGKTRIKAFVVPGSTPHLISRRWLSQHRCVVNFDPNYLLFGKPRIWLRSPCVALIWSFAPVTCESIKHVGPIHCHDRFQSSSTSMCTDFQKHDEQTMGSLQPRNQVGDRRAEPDEERAADSVVTGGSDPPDDFIVPSDDPNEEITEQWQDGLREWYICRDDQCSVEPTKISRDVSQR